MRSCSAAYVDVGYLLAAAATRVTGSSLRRGVHTEYAELIAALIAQMEADGGLPLLRVNWYDAGSRPGGMPDATQDAIGALPRVKLRLGRLSYSGEQKGVDVRIGLDLAIQAQHGVADVAYLVSGDDDLTEAVEEAQGRGVQVVVLAVPDHDARPLAVSRHLIRAADRVVLIDADVVDRTVKSMAIPEGLLASLTGDGEAGPVGAEAIGATSALAPIEAIETIDGAASGSPGSDGASRPPAAAAPGDGAAPGVPAAGGVPHGDPTRPRRRVRTHAGVPVASASETGPPAPGATADPAETAAGETGPGAAAEPGRSAALGTSAPVVTGQDPGAAPPLPPSPALFARRKATELVLPGMAAAMPAGTDEPVAAAPTGLTPEVVDDVAKRVVAAWCSSASPAALMELRAGGSAIPADLDRALLVDLAGRGGVDDLDDVSRHAVRDRFWYHVARVRMT